MTTPQVLLVVGTMSNIELLHHALHTYIHYYNETRLHSSLDYLSPLAFERRAA